MYIKFVKRFFDIILAVLALPFFLIILVILSPIIYFNDKGSVFYNSQRLGKNGKIFKMYKFRSMKMNVSDIRNEDGTTFNSEKDPRLTKIGAFLRKTSIDEIPQILNVFIGNMSIVGPRPDMPDALELYGNEFIRKLDLKPGITGLNQAYFRNSADLITRFKNDLFYVENISLFLDLKILLKTIVIVFKRKNIYKTELGDNK